jgi:alkyldihydroxyacetonephosphate synthase
MPRSERDGVTLSSRLETTRRSAADILDELRSVCAEVRDDESSLADASRDWWPLAMHWTIAGDVPAAASVVCRPGDAAEVAAVVRACHHHGVPVTPAGGRSGVCGASVPVFGGVVLDLTALNGVVAVDDTSLVADVRAGTFGHDLEAELRTKHTSTLGHWPQSIELSTVGGWLACRSAGQYSTRYGKIEDIVVGLDVVLADGSTISTGGYPRQAVGPDVTQLFVGSEGTLGVITGARLRIHPLPADEWRVAYGFDTFQRGVDACRRILRRGATPAVLRLYDAAESARSHGTDGAMCLLLVLDEADPQVLSAIKSIVEDECAGAARLDDELVGRWLEHRNDVSALHTLTAKGFVVDTMEVAAPWSRIGAVHDATIAALAAVPTTRAATAHLSHSYSDGACLYFTFAATPPADALEATYVALWDAGTRTALAHGASLSHHHGVGLNRARFVADALGPAYGVLRTLKSALDPTGVLNPGKLGLPSPFGEVPWPA